MKNALYLMTLLPFLYSGFAFGKPITHLVSEESYTCVFGEGIERCWGKEWKDTDWDVPLSIGNVSEIAATKYGFCAIVQEEIKCAYNIGKDGASYETVKGVKEPKKIASIDDRFCAIASEGVQCWSRDFNVSRDTSAPRFNNPTDMIMIEYGDGKCVIDGENTKCWGEWFKKFIGGVRLKGVVSIAVDLFRICGLTTNGNIKCQDHNDYIGSNDEIKTPYILKYLEDGKKLIKTRYRICALTKQDVLCWGHGDSYKVVFSELKGSFLIAGSRSQTCVADYEGVKCLGDAPRKKMDYIELGPTMSEPNFSLKDLSISLEAISKGSSPARTLLLSKISKYSKTQEASKPQTPMEEFSKTASAYTLAKLLYSAIKSGDSDYYRTKVIPAYQKSMDIIELELGIYELAGVPDLASTREAALKVIQSSVSVINEFLSSKDREKLSGVLRALGAAISNPMSDEKVSSLLDQLIENESIFVKLENSRKANFLTQTLSIAQEFLENKVR